MAIDELLDEHEQGERVQAWLRRNGAGLIGGVLLGLAAIGGWQWWGGQRHAERAGANGRYEAVVASIEAKDLDKASKDLAALTSGSASGVYAELAALRIASAQLEAGKGEEALKTLRSVKPDSAFSTIINQRIARLLIETGKPAEVQAVLGGAEDGSSLEIRADALVVQGKRDDARELYTKALGLVDSASPQRRVLETKLMDVGGQVPEPAQSI